MGSDGEDYGEINPLAHKQLLSEISDIVKTQHIKKATRSEPAIANSEFHLVKTKPQEGSILRDNKKVSISSIADIVRKNTKQKAVGKQLKLAFKNENTLNKPLEKIHSDRIGRTIAYDNTKKKLARWDAIVTKNQMADQLVFPLVQEKVSFRDKKKNQDAPKFRFKTDLMKKLEESQVHLVPHQNDTIEEINGDVLTLEEMVEKRKELARIRMKESYKINKTRMQGKIKSKKYHRLKKRDLLKQKIKEFEELKISDPEAAMKELEKIERYRVQERANLRHKNTGTWAKNLQVRAKYDVNVRQDLEAQLAISRELTQKNEDPESSESEDETENVSAGNQGSNPWLGLVENSKNLDEVFSGYKKFWEDHNANQKKLEIHQEKAPLTKKQKQQQKRAKVVEQEIVEVVTKVSQSGWLEEDNNDNKEEEDDENHSKFINDLFDDAENKIQENVEAKYSKMKPMLMEKKGFEKKPKKDDKRKRGLHPNDPEYLGFEKKVKLGDIDDSLMEGDENDEDSFEKNRGPRTDAISLLAEVKKRKEDKKITFKKAPADEINPDSFLAVKSKHLLTALPSMEDIDDFNNDVDTVENANRISLAEAFENDDIVNDFADDQEAEEKKAQGEDELPTLPGWGSWGGRGVKPKVKKPSKAIFKANRKDRIIVNQDINEKLQKHLVSSLPFPFTTIKDYEASMRAPIGREFVPETAHRKLTRSSIVTKAGVVIEPMSEDVLVKTNAKTIETKFDKKGSKGKGKGKGGAGFKKKKNKM